MEKAVEPGFAGANSFNSSQLKKSLTKILNREEFQSFMAKFDLINRMEVKKPF